MLKNYLLMAWKVLLRHKFFTFVSLFGISFTLMVLVPATAYLDSIIASSPPESRIDRMLFVKRMRIVGAHGTINESGPSYYFLNRYVRPLKTPAMVSIYSRNTIAKSYKNDRKMDLRVKYTDGNFWNILDFTFLEGRPFTVSEVDNALPIAVVNEQVGTQLFGKGHAVGKTIELEQQTYRIVGVVGNVSRVRESSADVWVPITTWKGEDFTKMKYTGRMNAMVLAADPADLVRIKAEFNDVVAKAEPPDAETKTIVCAMKNHLEWTESPKSAYAVEPVRVTFIQKFLLGVFLFLLLPTVNLVNMNISRIMDRASEIAIRKSFGATVRSLVLQFLVENLVLTLLGSIIGFGLGAVMLSIVNTSTNMGLVFSYRIVVYYLATTLFFGVLSGILPAYKMSRLQPVDGLKGAQR